MSGASVGLEVGFAERVDKAETYIYRDWKLGDMPVQHPFPIQIVVFLCLVGKLSIEINKAYIFFENCSSMF